MEGVETGGQNETVIDTEASKESMQKETSSQEMLAPTKKTDAGEVIVMLADYAERKGEGERQKSPEVPKVKDTSDQERKEEDEKKTEDLEAGEDKRKDGENHLDEKDTVTIDLNHNDEKIPGEDTPTLPLDEEKGEEKEEGHDMFKHPIYTMRHAWQDSKSVPEFFVTAIVFPCASLGWLFCSGCLLLLPFVMFIIGSLFVNDCPYEPNIPIYLIVAGLFGMIERLCAVVTNYLSNESEGFMAKHRGRCQCLDAILQILLFLWFIAGAIWVYGIYEPHYDDPNHKEYCNKTLYLFTYWLFNIFLIIVYIITFIFVCFMIVIMAAFIYVARSKQTPYL